MPIVMSDGCTVATGCGIEYVRLASLKGRVKLESVGMKSRVGPIRPFLAVEFGLKPRAPYADYIAAIQAKMDVILAETQKETFQ